MEICDNGFFSLGGINALQLLFLKELKFLRRLKDEKISFNLCIVDDFSFQ